LRYSDEAQISMFTAYTAYFDASGHPDDRGRKIITVAGFVSTVKKWSRFDADWNQVLKSEGVSAFHMTDFASSGGEFSGWKKQTERRKSFTAKLGVAMDACVNKGFRASVSLPAYKDINAFFLLSERIGRPFTICAIQALYQAKLWAKRNRG
jgi:hypothetical protein